MHCFLCAETIGRLFVVLCIVALFHIVFSCMAYFIQSLPRIPLGLGLGHEVNAACCMP